MSSFERDRLPKAFREAGLGLKVLGGPIEPRNRRIFQMDITRTPAFGEYFRIWPGASDNEIEVLSCDPTIRQLVLRVKEARRPYTQRIRKWPHHRRQAIEEQARQAGGRLVADGGVVWILELWTPGEERRFLCGKDDVNFFIAQVREGSTVLEAHDSLKPRRVKEAEALGETVLRQGEWFFLPLSAEGRAMLETTVQEQPGLLDHERPVGGSGPRPHVADDVVKIERRVQGKRGSFRHEEIYARGTVRHLDHRPLVLPDWRRVALNRQVVPSRNDLLRLRWID
jgi:hypothetical protein